MATAVPAWASKFYQPLPYDPTDQESIISFAGLLIQHRLGDKLSFWPIRAVNGKGKFGAILEEFYFFKKPDGLPEADFPAGIELKSAPLRTLVKQGLSVKERVSLGMIDYLRLPKETFEASSFLKKNSKILLVFYIHKRSELPTDAVIDNVFLWTIPPEDLPVIRADWTLIHKTVSENRATELSEGQTRYLGACTKGAGHGQVRRQADDSRAKPRAFSLKRSYVQYIYEKHIAHIANAAPLLKPATAAKKVFEDAIKEAFEKFYGLTAKQIAARLNVEMNENAKNFNAAITKKIFKVPADVEIEEFKKAGIVTKTIRVRRRERTPKEHISFPYFRPKQLIKETWESSTPMYQFSTRFFFVIYVEDGKGIYRLRETKFWAMPLHDIERYAKPIWEEARKRLKSPKKVPMPGQGINRVVHVRPHGRDGKDTVPTPGGWKITKPCFWLDSRYVSDQLALSELVEGRREG